MFKILRYFLYFLPEEYLKEYKKLKNKNLKVKNAQNIIKHRDKLGLCFEIHMRNNKYNQTSWRS